jgi:HK97 gp10 family phage protein
MPVKWFGERFLDKIKDGVQRHVLEAAEKVADQVRINIGQPCPPHSDPGDFPHRESGELQESIHVRMVAGKLIKAEVYSTSKKMVWLEFGTSRMAARPFLRRTLAEMGPIVRRIVSAKID